MSEPSLSVLICTYNRPHMLDLAMRALWCETRAKPDQVVIVNGGDERADEVVEVFRREQSTGTQTPIEIVLVKTVNKNLAASRNAGLPYCTGEIIAMTDDDAEVFPDWVSRLRLVHSEHPEAGAVGGPVIGLGTKSLVSRIADAITFPQWAEACYVRTLPGVNVSYKREVVEQIGQQDEALFRGEDVDYNWRLQQLGYKVYFDPAIKVFHNHRPTYRGLMNQHYMYGRAYYLVRRKWAEMYCVYPHHIRNVKDALKLFFPFYLILKYPLATIARLEPRDWLPGFPILCLIQAAWTTGIVRQGLWERTQLWKE